MIGKEGEIRYKGPTTYGRTLKKKPLNGCNLIRQTPNQAFNRIGVGLETPDCGLFE